MTWHRLSLLIFHKFLAGIIVGKHEYFPDLSKDPKGSIGSEVIITKNLREAPLECP
jgi:hypothetical protein